MNALASTQKYAKKYWLLLTIVVVMAILTIGFLAGYRIGAGGLPVKVGLLTFNNIPDGATIYVDSARQHVVRDGSATLRLTPGTHMVIVDAGTEYPWNELITITSDTETIATPIFVNTTTKPAPVTEDRLFEANRALAARILPTKAAPLATGNACAAIYVSGNRIVGEARPTEGCTVPPYLACDETAGTCPPTVIFEPGDRLDSVIPYPGRDDAMIVASGNIVYVLEIDPREPRFFAPLIKGLSVRAAPWSDSSIVVTGSKAPREIPL